MNSLGKSSKIRSYLIKKWAGKSSGPWYEGVFMKKNRTLLFFSSVFMLMQPLSEASAEKNSRQVINAEAKIGWVMRSASEIKASVGEALKNKDQVYTVQWGDTLSSIADASHLSINDLMRLNNIQNSDLIVAGRKIYLSKHLTNGNDFTSFNHNEAIKGNEIDQLNTTQADHSMVSYTSESSFSNVPLTADIFAIDSSEAAGDHLVAEIDALEKANVISTASSTEWIDEENLSVEIKDEADKNYQPTDPHDNYDYELNTSDPLAGQEDIQFSNAYEAFAAVVNLYNVSQEEQNMWANIIELESKWDFKSTNSYSGAYGLPQALPGNKMASHGDDWETNPYTQLRWMYDYMINRYGSITAAWNFWQANHWY